eukprot:TRINITY_DN10561_c0_g1_i2.p1 TRINITY_DN10561_c0_g1~~TRINITY_DN10561_c0_g1_i2.p1  ORF type:complete len:502 (+),score=80.15 TRINITY_DN10561_c0_g1_i2:81-1508(+)
MLLFLLYSLLWLLFYFAAVAAFLLVAYSLIQRKTDGKNRVAVVVVGDFGRSPRMQYHCISLSKVVRKVFVVAVEGSSPCEGVTAAGNINMEYLLKPAKAPASLPWILAMLYRVTLNSIRLPITLLFTLPKCDAFIIQNPPAIPVLPAAVLACKIRGIKLIVDWHNLGYTLLQMDNRPKAIISTYKFIERFFGSYSDYNLTVCESLKRFLKEDWKCIREDNSTVVYDVAPSFFSRSGPSGALKLFESEAGKELLGPGCTASDIVNHKGWNPNRPCILVTGTSWTVDEDVGMLLDSLSDLDTLLSDPTNGLPSKIIMFITGKGGDLKLSYEKRISTMNLKNIQIRTGYLDKFADYATLLGVADLGISLHNSSSGFDLPMKAVDMLGSRLPVLALYFDTLKELINKNNGDYFTTKESLSEGLDRLLRDWKVSGSDEVAATPLLQEKRSYIKENPRGTWDQQWGSKALPVIKQALNKGG